MPSAKKPKMVTMWWDTVECEWVDRAPEKLIQAEIHPRLVEPITESLRVCYDQDTLAVIRAFEELSKTLK